MGGAGGAPRSAGLVSGEPVAEPSHVHEMDADALVGIWDDAIVRGWQDFRPDRWYDDELRDDLTGVGGEAFLLTDELVEGLDEESDPSLFFRNLQQYCADNGITLTFARHPEYGDVLARVARMSG